MIDGEDPDGGKRKTRRKRRYRKTQKRIRKTARKYKR